MSRPIRESKVESYLKDLVANVGGLHFKMKSTRNGVPDQMIIYNGKIHLVEVKRPGEKPNPQQKYVHSLIEKQDIPVHITDTLESVDDFISNVLKATPNNNINKETEEIIIKSKNQFKIK